MPRPRRSAPAVVYAESPPHQLEEDSDCDERPSKSHQGRASGYVSTYRQSTRRAFIEYPSMSMDDFACIVDMIACNKVPYVAFSLKSGSFAQDPSSKNLWIVLVVNISIPLSKWNKISEGTGGLQVIMQTDKTLVYAYALRVLPFAVTVKDLTKNERAFKVHSFCYLLFFSDLRLS